jgi:hypothetical protein
MTYTPAPRHGITLPVVTPFHDVMAGLAGAFTTAPSSGSISSGQRVYLWPLYLREPFTPAKAFVCNGATIGTDSWDIGIYRMTDMSTGRCDLIRSTGAILSNQPVSAVQESGRVQISGKNITSGNDSTDGTAYVTASVTLIAGRCYLLSVANTAASAAVVSSITNGATWSSRSSTQFNTTAHRVSIWSGVPASDYTGTLTINFGATQTACVWSLNEFVNVDTASTDGVVQQAVGTGTSVTPLATLAAFGNQDNATFGALANISDTTTTPGTGFTELSDTASATPVACLETEWQVDNDTTVDGTITSAAWGACAVELKALTTTIQWRIARTNLTSGNDSTDSTTYTTASVTLKAGRLYLLSIVNTAASADVVSSIAGGPTWTSRSSVQFNTTGHRTNVWSGVPTTDYTGTIVVTYGATQTGACWVLDEFSGVDTSSNDGIVQQGTATGNSATPLVTLSSAMTYGNATFGATGVANASTVAPGTGFTELAEATAATPASRVETEWRVDHEPRVTSTVTSGQWGICGIEMKVDTSALVIPPSMPGNPNIYMGMVVTGVTATVLRSSPGVGVGASRGVLTIATAEVALPSSLTATTGAAVTTVYPLAGFSSRSLIG